MKKIICLLMVFATLATCIIGCSKEEIDESDTVIAEEVDENPPYDPAIDNLDLGGMEVTLFYADVGGVPRNEYEAEEYSSDPISNVIFKRNIAVEEKFNAKLKFQHMGGTEMVNELKNRYNAQDQTVDIIAPYAFYGTALTVNGVYANLNKLDYINPEMTWWNQSYVDAITYNKRLYTIIGDVTTTATSSTVATFVNMDMMEEFQLDDVDLFKVVEDGEWTLDYMMELCKNVYSEEDGVNDRSEGDRYGYILGQISQPAEALLVSFGFQWTRTNDDGTMECTLNDKRNIDILGKLNEFYNSNNIGIYKVAAPAESEFATKGVARYIELFTTGKTMVTMSFLMTAEELVKTEIEYLVLPTPKYSKDQEDYRSMTHDSHCSIAISSTSDAKNESAAVLEYMGYYSEKELTPQYFGISYKARYASNSKTMALFDTVVDSLEFDFARTYSNALNNITHNMRNLVKDSQEISSSIAKYQRSGKSALAEFSRKFSFLAE